MKLFFKTVFECFLTMIVVILSIAFVLIPTIVYEYNGGSSETIDYALRCFGFIVWLFIFMKVMKYIN